MASEDSRFNTLIDMEYGPVESIYFGIMGGFQATKDEDSAKTVGFSISNDRGETWSDFDICPFSIIREYAERNGLKKDSVWTSWDSQDMVVFDNGDVSFGVLWVTILKEAVRISSSSKFIKKKANGVSEKLPIGKADISYTRILTIHRIIQTKCPMNSNDKNC